jgi:hypothetical protein
MMIITGLPLSVLNRALELYNTEAEATATLAWDALQRAQARKDVTPDFAGITPLAQAVAEYMSLSGPWAGDGGAHAGQNGFLIDIR